MSDVGSVGCEFMPSVTGNHLHGDDYVLSEYQVNATGVPPAICDYGGRHGMMTSWCDQGKPVFPLGGGTLSATRCHWTAGPN